MKNYNKTDYAANITNEDAIVYRFADGTIKHITVDYFGGDEEAFRKWKEISDKDYYAEDRKASNISKKEVPLSVAGDLEKYSTPSFEDDYFGKKEEIAFSSEMQKFISSLTRVQKRRLFLMAFRDMGIVDIANLEGVNHKSVCETFTNIENKFKKFFKIPPENGKKKTLSERINFIKQWIMSHPENE